jgi:hypothetical protein
MPMPMSPQQIGVLAAEPDGASALMIDVAHDRVTDLPDQHHLHDLHGLRVRHAHPVNEARSLAETPHQVADLRPAPVDDHRPDS